MGITKEIYKNKLIQADFDSDTSSSINREKNFIPTKSKTLDPSYFSGISNEIKSAKNPQAFELVYEWLLKAERRPYLKPQPLVHLACNYESCPREAIYISLKSIYNGSFFLTPERIEDKKDEIETFNRLIEKRIEYLNNLENLNDDWITGKSIAPNKYVLKLGKHLLLDVSKFISEYKYLPIPKLLIGPIPTGGISIEFIVSENKKILINIYNNKTYELEYEKDGFYQEVIPLDDSSLSNQLVNTYLSLA